MRRWITLPLLLPGFCALAGLTPTAASSAVTRHAPPAAKASQAEPDAPAPGETVRSLLAKAARLRAEQKHAAALAVADEALAAATAARDAPRRALAYRLR